MAHASTASATNSVWRRRTARIGRGLRRGGKWLLVAIVLLAIVRMVLPVGLEALVNRRLAAIPGYAGRVEDIDVSIVRGAYQLEGLRIDKHGETAVHLPLVQADTIDFSLAWGELLRGRVLSEIHADGLAFTLVQGESAAESQTPSPVERRWQAVVNDLFPIEITHLEVTRGQLRFFNAEGELPYDIRLREVELVAADLRNRSAPDEKMPARLRLTATTDAGGRMQIDGRGEPLADAPRFDVNVEVQHIALPQLNDFLRAYANVDVRAGSLSVYGEFAAADGEFEGYVKPFLENVDFADSEGQRKSLSSRFWEAIVSGLAFVFKNHERDQLGTRVPISGEFGQADVGTLATIGNTVRHAFIQAFSERVDHTLGDPDASGDGGEEPRGARDRRRNPGAQ